MLSIMRQMNGSSHYMLRFQDTLSASKHWFVDILLLGIQMYQIKQGKKATYLNIMMKNLSCSQEKCFVEMQRLWAFQIRDLIFSTN
uniref:Uncharacterized protein n=1 Tax=Triticum urartu TaxID=4572 RepID=A0A8R7QGU9_TRIUA